MGFWSWLFGMPSEETQRLIEKEERLRKESAEKMQKMCQKVRDRARKNCKSPSSPPNDSLISHAQTHQDSIINPTNMMLGYMLLNDNSSPAEGSSTNHTHHDNSSDYGSSHSHDHHHDHGSYDSPDSGSSYDGGGCDSGGGCGGCD